MKKFLTICCYLVVLAMATGAYAQFNNQGTAAATFLKIGIGARAQGMGSAFVAQADDISALYYNPAGIAKIQGTQLGFSQVSWIADVKLSFVGAVIGLPGFGQIGVSVIGLTMDEMAVTNWEHPSGTGETFSSNNLCAGLTWANQITDRFSAGITVKYIQEKISNSSATGFAMDIGTQYTTNFHGLKIGMTLSNFGSKLKMSGRDTDFRTDPYPTEGSNPDDVWTDLRTEGWSMPTEMRIGMAIDLLNSENLRVTNSVDFSDYADYEPTWHIGLEVGLLKDLIMLRTGYQTREDDNMMTFGGGIRYQLNNAYTFMLDYAFVSHLYLGSFNRFSLALGF
ncbi:PorV/PorQ family protein [bacterium]|nr:PorV/PorQ family protein [bacterium]